METPDRSGLGGPGIWNAWTCRRAPRSRLLRRILRHGRRWGPRGTPFAQKMCFGWVLAGPIQSKGPQPAVYTCCLPAENDCLRKFCEIEDNSLKHPLLSSKERTMVKHYEPLHSRENHGRFVVPPPRKSGVKALRESRTSNKNGSLSTKKKIKNWKPCGFSRLYVDAQHGEIEAAQ